MHRAIEARAPTRHLAWRWVLALCLAGAVVAAWAWWAAGATPVGSATEAAPWWFGIAALLGVGGAGAAAGHFHARWREAQRQRSRNPAPSEGALGDHATLCMLMDTLPGPAWVFVRHGEHEPLALHCCNDAADRWLREQQAAPPADWQALLATLPAPMARAVRQMVPGQTTQEGGWALRLEQKNLPGSGCALALMLQPANSEANDLSEHRKPSATPSRTTCARRCGWSTASRAS